MAQTALAVCDRRGPALWRRGRPAATRRDRGLWPGRVHVRPQQNRGDGPDRWLASGGFQAITRKDSIMAWHPVCRLPARSSDHGSLQLRQSRPPHPRSAAVDRGYRQEPSRWSSISPRPCSQESCPDDTDRPWGWRPM